jgi:hypothetical protein
MKIIIINSDQQKRYALSLVGEMEPDGIWEVTVKKTDHSSTAKQRRLRWMWAGEVAASGLGRHDTKAGVDRAAKWQFARPILERDDDIFKPIFDYFMETVQGTVAFAECCARFTDQYISVERMTRRQEAEYLTEFQRYWIGKGVELTDPATQGVDLEKLYRMAA